MNGLRVVFMGTPDFSVPALRALREAGHEVIAVYSQPPRPKGRGQNLQPSPVQQEAEKHGIPVFTPKSLKGAEAQKEFAGLNADIAVVVAYGLILPRAVLDAPKHGCLNIHASLLPRWRGASPIQHAIWTGDTRTGISIMQMDEGLDTGPVISMRAFDLKSRTTAAALHDTLAALGAEMIVETLRKLAKDGTLAAQPQDESRSTYAPLLKKENGKIDWKHMATAIDRQIRALNPWPGVFCGPEENRLKILDAAPAGHGADADPGTVLDRTGRVACGAGTILKIQTIQPAGGKPMDFESAVNGGYIAPGSVLS